MTAAPCVATISAYVQPHRTDDKIKVIVHDAEEGGFWQKSPRSPVALPKTSRSPDER